MNSESDDDLIERIKTMPVANQRSLHELGTLLLAFHDHDPDRDEFAALGVKLTELLPFQERLKLFAEICDDMAEMMQSGDRKRIRMAAMVLCILTVTLRVEAQQDDAVGKLFKTAQDRDDYVAHLADVSALAQKSLMRVMPFKKD